MGLTKNDIINETRKSLIYSFFKNNKNANINYDITINILNKLNELYNTVINSKIDYYISKEIKQYFKELFNIISTQMFFKNEVITEFFNTMGLYLSILDILNQSIVITYINCIKNIYIYNINDIENINILYDINTLFNFYIKKFENNDNIFKYMADIFEIYNFSILYNKLVLDNITIDSLSFLFNFSIKYSNVSYYKNFNEKNFWFLKNMVLLQLDTQINKEHNKDVMEFVASYLTQFYANIDIIMILNKLDLFNITKRYYYIELFWTLNYLFEYFNLLLTVNYQILDNVIDNLVKHNFDNNDITLLVPIFLFILRYSEEDSIVQSLNINQLLLFFNKFITINDENLNEILLKITQNIYKTSDLFLHNIMIILEDNINNLLKNTNNYLFILNIYIFLVKYKNTNSNIIYSYLNNNKNNYNFDNKTVLKILKYIN